MSRTNAEIVLEGFPIFEAEDFDELERLWHPDGRVTAPAGWPEPGPFEGRDAVIAQFRRIAADVDEHHFRDVELVAESDDWVVVSFLWDIRGAGSGASFAAKMAAAYRVGEGKLREAHFTWSAEDALEVAGLARSGEPEENAEIVIEVSRRLDAEEFEEAEPFWHPDCRVTAPEGWPEPGPFEGRDAVFEQFRLIVAGLEEHSFDDLEVLADRDEWVVVSYSWKVRGAESGAGIASRMAAAYGFEEGRIKQVHFCWTPEEALEAAGFSAQS
jgi:ketosteroid isomerase-like protein